MEVFVEQPLASPGSANYKMIYVLQQRCRTTRSCRHKALLSSSGPDSIKKYSWSAHRADRSRQRQARLHTVGFGLARAGGLIASLCAEWPKASLFCSRGKLTKITISQNSTKTNISYKTMKMLRKIIMDFNLPNLYFRMNISAHSYTSGKFILKF